MGDVHTKAIRSKNNLSRFSGWQPLKARTQSPKCWCESLFLAKYFADKAIKEADDIWDKKSYSNQTIEQWLNEDNEPYQKDDTK